MFIGFLRTTRKCIVCVGVVFVQGSFNHFTNPADNQHIMLRELVGKYPPILPQVLADDIPGERKACLDLGCGSGGWYEFSRNAVLVHGY
jgi:predicted TPR repeat methyltransferase